MKKRKISTGYWVALAFVGLSLLMNVTIRQDDGEIITFNNWLIEKQVSPFITIPDAKLNTIEAVYFEETKLDGSEVLSRSYFIPMYSSIGTSLKDEKIQMLYRATRGRIFDFLEEKLNNSGENIKREFLSNPTEFVFEGPFSGGIQNSNAAMRKIQDKMPNLDSDFKVFSPAESSPQKSAIKILIIAFASILTIIGYKLYIGSKS